MGSLLDGIDVAQAKGKVAPVAAATDKAKTVKLALAVCGLMIGGVLIAWNLGAFGEAKPPVTAAAAEQAPANAPPVVQKVNPPRALEAQQPSRPTNQLIEQSSR